MMVSGASVYRVLQHLSIDIVFGATILLHFFSRAFSVEVPWIVYFLLGAAVWMIYTIDHLRDAEKPRQSKRGRYAFHRKHRLKLKFMVLLVGLLSVILSLIFLPETLWVGGSVITTLVILYILSQSKLADLGLKELYIAIVYTAGILLTPISLGKEMDWFLGLMLFLITYLNLIIFSWFEARQDFADNFGSIATKYTPPLIEKVIFIMLSIGMTIVVYNLQQPAYWSYNCYFLFVFIVFTTLVIKKEWAGENERYRTLGDGVFLFPLFFEWL